MIPMRIIALDDRIGDQPLATWLLFLIREHWGAVEAQAAMMRLQVPFAHSDVPLQVEANAGRWIVRCPSCPSAQIAHRRDLRFMCVDCLNQGSGGGWLQVEWPPHVAEIERVLLQRPNPMTRNWRPGEPLAALEAENIARLTRAV